MLYNIHCRHSLLKNDTSALFWPGCRKWADLTVAAYLDAKISTSCSTHNAPQLRTTGALAVQGSVVQAVLSNWGQEFAKWAPDIGVVMYDGAPDERKQLQKEQVEKGTFNVLITHYDLVMRDKAALRKVHFLCFSC